MHDNLVDKTELCVTRILVCFQAAFMGNQKFPNGWLALRPLSDHFSWAIPPPPQPKSLSPWVCESFLIGFPASSLASFFSLSLNTVAKRIMLKHRLDHIPPLFKSLQSLPISLRINPKFIKWFTKTSMICIPLPHFLSAINFCYSTWLNKESDETGPGWSKNCSPPSRQDNKPTKWQRKETGV